MARSFSGGTNTDRIVFATVAALNNLRPVSVSAWIWITAYDSTTRRIYDKFQGQADGAWHSLAYCYHDGSSDRLVFEVGLWNGGFGGWSVAGPSAGAWHHVLVTYAYNATSDVPVIYVDGTSVSVTTLTTPSGTIGSESVNLCLGNRDNDQARCWNGRLGVQALWNEALNANEALALARGVPAWRVRPSALKFNPSVEGLESPEVDGGPSHLSGTVTGATKVNDPPIGVFTPMAAASAPLSEEAGFFFRRPGPSGIVYV